jgi:hypothetical protein
VLAFARVAGPGHLQAVLGLGHSKGTAALMIRYFIRGGIDADRSRFV